MRVDEETKLIGITVVEKQGNEEASADAPTTEEVQEVTEE